MNVMKVENLQIPPTLKQNIEDVINIEFKDLLSNGNFSIQKMEELCDEVLKWDINLNRDLLNARLNDKLDSMFKEFMNDYSTHQILLDILKTIRLIKKVKLNPILVNLQNGVFELSRKFIAQAETPVDGQQVFMDTMEEIAREINIDLSYLREQVLAGRA